MISAQRIRWSDEDRYFGPFLYAPDKCRNLALVLGSGDDEEYPGCRLRMSAFGHTVILSLPPILKPWKEVVIVPSWRTDGTAERLGRDWYHEPHEREYGFSYGTAGSVGGGGFLQVLLGRQTMDSNTTQSWSILTPWNNWRFVRYSLYDLEGKHFWTEPQRGEYSDRMEFYEVLREYKEACPSKTFSFTDFDGEEITVKTKIEEREWRLGEGWFKWLSVFKKPLIQRSLDLDFSKEVGRRKGSWKGGTTGHSIGMLPGELHEGAFRRYSDGDDRDGPRDMTFIGEM